MILDSEDDEFKFKVADTIMEFRLSGDKSHEHARPSEHLEDVFHHICDAIQHIYDAIQHCANAISHFIFNHNYKRVELNPIGQHFVMVLYHGSKPMAAFTITVEDYGM